MKISKFETKDHPLLGNCSLDFSSNNIVSDVVLIAGSNGSGKTTLLNEIFDFVTNIRPTNQHHDISITFELRPEEVASLQSIESGVDHILKIESLRPNIAGEVNWGQIRISNSHEEIGNNFVRSDVLKELLKIVYSTVEINFASSQINTTTSKDIDTEKAPKEKSTGNISQEITQLLVDIKALDNQDAADWVESNNGQTVAVSNTSKRITRFKKAFDSMIEGKTFEGVKNENNRKKVYFKDSFNNEIELSSLSSGEKQIVFRAGYLLKNIGTLSGGMVLIDEPEISFHPSWQEKYVQFVKKVFSDDQGVLQSQIIITTHSPFIIQNENITDEKIIILEKNDKNTVESIWPKFYGYKQPEPVFVPIQATIKPLLLVEGKSDKQIINHAWKRLYPNEEIFFDIKWPNEPNEGGAREVQKQLNYFVQHGTSKVLGMFDADMTGINNYNGTVYKHADFIKDNTIDNLKISSKVGVTFIPICSGREIYFSSTSPQYCSFVLELYFPDTVLQTLNLTESQKIILGTSELVKIKTNHQISDSDLEGLKDDDFEKFKILFDHIIKCFDRLN